MKNNEIENAGRELYRSMVERKTIEPLSKTYPDMSIEDAYRVSLSMLDQRLLDGTSIIGKKIGVTSKSVQTMLGVYQPDFGYLTNDMAFNSGEEMPIKDKLIQPGAEGEIAFLLKKDITGPGVTVADVLAATECVMPCFEIVDSRIENWEITIYDTIADNASCGLFMLGDNVISPRKIDLATCGIVMEKNGNIISTGAGAAALGSPVNCVVWLANTLGKYGISLKAGEIILSGSLVPLEKVQSGDSMRLSIGGIGSASVRFI